MLFLFFPSLPYSKCSKSDTIEKSLTLLLFAEVLGRNYLALRKRGIMSNGTKSAAGEHLFIYSLLYGLIVIAAAQLRISLFTEHFVVSAGVILFALLMLILDEFATLPVVFISAVGIMVTRAFLNAGQMVDPDQIWATGMPEFAFYIVYGVVIYLLFRYGRAEGSYVWTFIALIIPDFVANVMEMYIRTGADAGHARILLILLAVAVVRSLIILAIYVALLHYGLPLVKIPRGGIGKQKEFTTEAAISNTEELASLQCAAQHAAALCQELETIQVSEELRNQAKALTAELNTAAGEEE